MKKEIFLERDDNFGWNIHPKLNDDFSFYGWLELESEQTVAYQISIIKNLTFFNIPVYKMILNLVNLNTGTNFVFNNYSFSNKTIYSDDGNLKFGKEMKILKFPDHFNIDFKNEEFSFDIDLYYKDIFWLFNENYFSLITNTKKNIECKHLFANSSFLKTSGVLRIKGYDFKINGLSFYQKGFGQFSETKIINHYQKINLILEDKQFLITQYTNLINKTIEILKENQEHKEINSVVYPLDFFVYQKNNYALKWKIVINESEEYYLESISQVLSNRYQFAIIKDKEGKIIGRAFIETLPTFYNAKIQSLL